MAMMTTEPSGPAGNGGRTSRSAARTGTLDERFVAISITSVFGAEGMSINGTAFQPVFNSSNGLVTFPSGVTTLGQPVLAPFWADTDITRGGDVCWDQGPSAGRVPLTRLNVAAGFATVTTNAGCCHE